MGEKLLPSVGYSIYRSCPFFFFFFLFPFKEFSYPYGRRHDLLHGWPRFEIWLADFSFTYLPTYLSVFDDMPLVNLLTDRLVSGYSLFGEIQRLVGSYTFPLFPFFSFSFSFSFYFFFIFTSMFICPGRMWRSSLCVPILVLVWCTTQQSNICCSAMRDIVIYTYVDTCINTDWFLIKTQDSEQMCMRGYVPCPIRLTRLQYPISHIPYPISHTPYLIASVVFFD